MTKKMTFNQWNAARRQREKLTRQAQPDDAQLRGPLPAERYQIRRHSIYHVSINRVDQGKVLWRMNFYESTGKIWCDPNFADPPELDLPRKWTVADVVAALAKLDGMEKHDEQG
jgi:hypothetical protein